MRPLKGCENLEKFLSKDMIRAGFVFLPINWEEVTDEILLKKYELAKNIIERINDTCEQQQDS